ncbi:glycosyltransferase family A protein [uncultured Chryseobacterium sp.]|uniref:glycosyltransferase family 2 protein n=1 Tax=uncultured Chryseobacterium sp. TaxID=259322 RepID=UPI0025EE8DED|nr:glycosyltransferase family A protein [uncultured Chryseobacterium sp.]
MAENFELKKVSVVIPLYNAEGTIVRSLESVINQTYQGSVEIIVVNDGSKDNSKIEVEKFIENNPTIKIKLINQENGGVSKARNTGLKNAEGDFIALLDSDDAWELDKLEIQMKYFSTHVDFICALRNNDTLGFPYRIKNGISKITLKKLLTKVVGQTSTAIFKRDIIENTGYFDEDQKYSEDANYWMRISINNNMIILNQKLVITENDYGQKGLSSNLYEMEKGVQKNIKEMFILKKINILEYYFFKLFSRLKYLRRLKIINK